MLGELPFVSKLRSVTLKKIEIPVSRDRFAVAHDQAAQHILRDCL